mgnify:CR=1 FL=1
MNIYMKRIYTAASDMDGKRILVDRLWPRGIKKEDAKIDLWAKEITPSTELRKWYHQDIEHRWDEFQQRYKAELMEQPEMLQYIRKVAQQEKVTLITSTKNEHDNHETYLYSRFRHG